ncbi:putative phage tail protein [Rummeliibacillus sp. POC4]|uniref:putative phage tail protein n=1 Tax=Rummeliibacillus sp. POC4 TaxID=2305899 RepID=UPI000E669EFC|nr:putative phage tail protein [Rummeliibacillus sp. POC4]RIJ63596.1 DUF2313 domain-containing protein [Rummeliibacillus sp. POC4]
MSMKITTKTGKEMLESVTPIYNNDDYALSIFEANGKIMDEISVIIKQTIDQAFPQKASWSLNYWEEKLGIKNMANRMDKERIQQVLYELNKYFSISRYRMEMIVNNFVDKKNATVEEEGEEYAFRIIIPVDSKIGIGLRQAIEDVKPAHLLPIFERVIEAGSIVVTGGTYHYPVYYPETGEFSGEKNFSQFDTGIIENKDDSYIFEVEYPVSEKMVSIIECKSTSLTDSGYSYAKNYPETGEMTTLNKLASTQESSISINQENYCYRVICPVCGEIETGGEW